MRISTTAIAAVAAILVSVLSSASAQDAPMVITPQPNADAPYGEYTPGQASPGQVNPGPTYEAQGYASEKLPDSGDGTFSMEEIKGTGHRVFGKVSVGFAKVVEHAFSRYGRPNGYILGEEAGGAFVAGLRYGEGVLYTKDAGRASRLLAGAFDRL